MHVKSVATLLFLVAAVLTPAVIAAPSPSVTLAKRNSHQTRDSNYGGTSDYLGANGVR
jgi:hypothetical protein